MLEYEVMFEGLRVVLEADSRIAYALLFGSSVKGTTHLRSDVDVAIGVIHGRRLDLMEIGDVRSRLEAAVGRPVDLVILDEAPPGLAYRVFRDGRLIFARDEQSLAARRARAILEYIDFRPLEELCARGVLAANGR
jgi:predicted nucleotidyltransferase